MVDMSEHRRPLKTSRTCLRLIVWAIIISAMAIVSNWPRNGGSLKSWLWDAGFPIIYANWDGPKLIDFHLGALLIDLLLWLAFFVGIAIATWFAPRRNCNCAADGSDGN
jgi:hypothetical protein